MKPRIKIGITLRTTREKGYEEIRNAISCDWVYFLEKLGFSVLLIPSCLKDPVAFFAKEGCNVLLLTGGEDVGLYLKKKGSFGGLKRDIAEAKLLKYAVKKCIPTVGVCRGMQVINIFFGGKIKKSIKGHVNKKHKVFLADDNFKKLFSYESFYTNSYHKNGVTFDGIAKDLIPWAVKNDVIEGLYHKKYPIFGVQWHPERKNSATKIDYKLFNVVSKKF